MIFLNNRYAVKFLSKYLLTMSHEILQFCIQIDFLKTLLRFNLTTLLLNVSKQK